MRASAASDENGFNEILLAHGGRGHGIFVRPYALDGGQWLLQKGVAFCPSARTSMPSMIVTSQVHLTAALLLPVLI